jgi:hypothetical protein
MSILTNEANDLEPANRIHLRHLRKPFSSEWKVIVTRQPPWLHMATFSG